jgi:hypothetical protein
VYRVIKAASDGINLKYPDEALPQILTDHTYPIQISCSNSDFGYDVQGIAADHGAIKAVYSKLNPSTGGFYMGRTKLYFASSLEDSEAIAKAIKKSGIPADVRVLKISVDWSQMYDIFVYENEDDPGTTLKYHQTVKRR